ncbi:hypothetical protein [Alteribacter keqinensis]|uniref:hypothetical protein n=1 Tax=Alteribacter keqinensis TaxID=2483800 RepID=UPI0016061C16|nr:hypothetical protein [Alteribacter keqinensis]
MNEERRGKAVQSGKGSGNEVREIDGESALRETRREIYYTVINTNYEEDDKNESSCSQR